jgi:hypothetical protein
MILLKITNLFYLFTFTVCINWANIAYRFTPVIEEVEVDESGLDKEELSKFISEVDKIKNGTSTKNYLQTKITPSNSVKQNFSSRFLKVDDVNTTVDQINNYEVPEFDESKPKKRLVNPGTKMIMSFEAIKNVIDCYMEDILTMILSDPMDIQFKYMFMTLNQIYMKIKSFDIYQIKFEPNEEQNILGIILPPINLTLFIKTALKMGFEFEGFVEAELLFTDLVLYLQFYDDPEHEFFKPRIKLMMNDFDVAKSILKLKATFKGISDKLIDSILYLFNSTITKALQSYIRTSFVEEGSLMLNFAIDSQYPSIISPLGDDLRMSTLMTREPLVSKEGLLLSLAGDIFSTNLYNELSYVPTSSENPLMEPMISEGNNLQIMLSETFIKKTLNNFLNKRLMQIDSLMTSYKFFIMDILNSTITVDSNGIGFTDVDLFLYTKKPEFDEKGISLNHDQIMKISIRVLISSFDLENSKLYLNITDLKILYWDDNFVTSFISTTINMFIHGIVKLFNDGNYDLPHINLNPNLSVSNIYATYGDKYIMINGKLDYNEPQVFYFI